jgi:hypothetical protein
MDKLKLFFANWKTTIPAVLATICATDAVYLKILPPEWEQHGAAACIFLISIGLIAAKDADKTHSKVIVQPQPQPVTVPVEGIDVKKTLPVILLSLLLFGCGTTKGTWLDTTGTMLDGTVCTIAAESSNADMTDQIIHTYVNQKDQDKAQAYLLTAKLGATALCEMLRARQAVVAQGQAAPVSGTPAPDNPS